MNNLNVEPRFIWIGRTHPIWESMHKLSKSLRAFYHKNRKKLYWDRDKETINVIDGPNDPFDIGTYDPEKNRFVPWEFGNSNFLKSC